MDITSEFILSLGVQLLILAFFVGLYVSTIKFMGQQILEIKNQIKDDKQELKDEMRRYNDVLSRMAVAENSIKSAHHRIDTLEVKE